jgi:antigen flippase
VNSSGDRQIAEAAGTGDTERIAKTAAVLRRTSLVLGVLGAISLAAFSKQVSTITFGGPQHAAAVALLSLVVLFRLVSDGQAALIQGMRRIADLARMNVLGAVFGTLIAIPMVYFFRAQGVVPSLVAAAGMAILTSWWFSRRANVAPSPVTLADVGQEASELLKLGFVFMASGLMTMGVAYVVRIILVRQISLEAAGLYQSAWTLGGLYVGFILQAMSADFYPRLTAAANNNAECNRLVNEQTLVGLLLAGPGVIATLTFAPLVIYLFYSARFAPAVPLLRWICLGALLQVLSWPMGFIIVAKANKVLFFVAEFAWALAAIAMAWICVRNYGVNGAGIAFFGSYVFHALLIYGIVGRFSGFRWSAEAKRTGQLLTGLIAIVFVASFALSPLLAAAAGAVAAILSGFHSAHILVNLTSPTRVSHSIRGWLDASRFTRRRAQIDQ